MTATRRTGATPRGQPQPQGRHATYTRTTIQTRCRAPRTLLGSGAWSPRVGRGMQGPGFGPALVAWGLMGRAGVGGAWRQRGCSAPGTRREARVVWWGLCSGLSLAQTPALPLKSEVILGKSLLRGSFWSFRRGSATYLAGLL